MRQLSTGKKMNILNMKKIIRNASMMINNKHNAFYNLVSHWRHVCLTVLSMQQLRQLKTKTLKFNFFQGDQNRQWEPNFETKNGSVHYLRKTFIFFSSFKNFYDIIFYDFITHKFGQHEFQIIGKSSRILTFNVHSKQWVVIELLMVSTIQSQWSLKFVQFYSFNNNYSTDVLNLILLFFDWRSCFSH